MENLKTQPTDASVSAFLDGIEEEKRRKDGWALLELMCEVTGEEPIMWGPSIVGFGRYHYKYASGREGDWMITGFSPRKSALTLYIMPGFEDEGDLLARLGKFKTGKSCLYLRRLADVDREVLKELVRKGFVHMRARYGT